jgi:hypothetical protein
MAFIRVAVEVYENYLQKIITVIKETMATRALIRFAERQSGVSFSDFKLWHGGARITHQIYHHYDGSPGFLGVAIADFIKNVGQAHNGVDCFAAQLLTHLKLGVHYGKVSNDSHNVYLETPGREHGDLDYTYYLWWGKGQIWISIFRYDHTTKEHCEFVGEARNLIFKYKLNTKTNG